MAYPGAYGQLNFLNIDNSGDEEINIDVFSMIQSQIESSKDNGDITLNSFYLKDVGIIYSGNQLSATPPFYPPTNPQAVNIIVEITTTDSTDSATGTLYIGKTGILEIHHVQITSLSLKISNKVELDKLFLTYKWGYASTQ